MCETDKWEKLRLAELLVVGGRLAHATGILIKFTGRDGLCGWTPPNESEGNMHECLNTLASEMDRLGVAGCKEHLAELVAPGLR